MTSKPSPPCDYEFLDFYSFPEGIEKSTFFPDLGSKNGLQFLDVLEISVGVKKKNFVFGKFGANFFFLYGTVTFNGISRFSIFDEVLRKIKFSVKS